MKLRRFYFAHRELFVIPVEHLGEAGMSDAFADALREDRGTSDEWIDLFNRAYATYWERAGALYRAAPDEWFPPRLQNLCVVLEPEWTRPYYQPFHKCSWLLYASDFDPAVSELEFATYQLLHAERLSTSRDMAMAVICGMSYWHTRSEAERERFIASCLRAPRPDAAVFRRLAEAMPWVLELYHPRLHPPPAEPGVRLGHVREAGLLVPPSAQEGLHKLVPALRSDAAAVMEAYLERTARAPATDPAVALASSPEAHVCEWLAGERPPVLVTDERDAVLWDPDAPSELDALRRALEGIGGRVAQSLREDLEVVGGRSARYLASLRHPERLPAATDDVEQEGGVFVHGERRIIVYSLAQPGLDPRREPAPPYHRLLVGARTIHEWGHLSEDAGWVGLPQAREAEHQQAQAEIDQVVQRLLGDAPPAFVAAATEEARAAGREPGRLVCDLVLSRMSDYLSNLLARRYLSEAELEAYIRANVHTHFDQGLRPLHLLGRHAYEFQYLGLGPVDDPMRYFVRSTWFSDYFIETGLVQPEHLAALFDATARLCGCYEVDESAFVPASDLG